MSLKKLAHRKSRLFLLLISIVSSFTYAADEKTTYYLHDIEIANDLGITEDDIKCDVQSVLTYTIFETVEKFSINIIPVTQGVKIPADALYIKVTIEDYRKPVVVDRLLGLTASLSIHAEIIQNDKTVYKFDRTSESGNGLTGSCGALKHTAEYLGVAVTKWVAGGKRVADDKTESKGADVGNYVSAEYPGGDVRNYMAEEDFPTLTMEEAKNFEVSHYLDVINKGSLQELKVAKSETFYFAIDDVRLHDEIEKLVLSGYEDSSEENLPRLSNLIIMLGYSGNEKYLPTLNTIKEKASSSKVASYAEQAEEFLKKQSKDKLVINKDIDSAKPYERFQKRISNMINSGDNDLVMRGVKYANKYYLNDNATILIVREYINNNYMRDVDGWSEERQFIRTMYSMMRYLVSAPMDSRPLLINISKNAGEKKVGKLAKKLLRIIKRST